MLTYQITLVTSRIAVRLSNALKIGTASVGEKFLDDLKDFPVNKEFYEQRNLALAPKISPNRIPHLGKRK